MEFDIEKLRNEQDEIDQKKRKNLMLEDFFSPSGTGMGVGHYALGISPRSARDSNVASKINDTYRDPMKDYLEKRGLIKAQQEDAEALAAKDPNSEFSKKARETLYSAMPSYKGKFDSMSAAQLEKASPILMAKMKAELSRQSEGSGKPPAGYRFKADGSLEPIPGGPASMAADKKQQTSTASANIVAEDIGRALNLLGESKFAAGPYAGKTSVVPGTPAWEMSKMLDSIKANIAFDKLQQMRESSPTGGALGAVSDKEMALLQSAFGKIDTDMPDQMLKDNLNRALNMYLDVIHGPGKGPERNALSFDSSGKPGTSLSPANASQDYDSMSDEEIAKRYQELMNANKR